MLCMGVGQPPPEAPKWPLQRAEGPPKTGYKLTMGDDGTQLHHTCFLPGNAGFTSQFETNSAYKLLLLFNPPSSQSPLVPPSSLESPQVPTSSSKFSRVPQVHTSSLKPCQVPLSASKSPQVPQTLPVPQANKLCSIAGHKSRCSVGPFPCMLIWTITQKW